MNGDVKAAVERFHEWEFDGLDARDHKALLAHIDGEPARTAAAVAAAREETVAACAVEFERALAEGEAFTLTGLATPLADELERSWQQTARMVERAEKAEAERDALRAQLHQAAERLDEFGSQPTLADGIQAMRLRLVELRAQVEAARAWATRNTEVLDIVEPATDPWTAGYDDAITDVLAAMDGAKP